MMEVEMARILHIMFTFRIIKVCVFYTVLCNVLIITMLSRNYKMIDWLSFNEKGYVESNKADSALEKIKQISLKSELLLSNSTTYISQRKSSDIFKVKIQSDLLKLINPPVPKFALTVNGSYLLENKNRCSSVPNLTIIIMVLSAPKHFQRRNVIRETWANDKFYSYYGTTRVLFLLGITNISDVQRNIEKEFKHYGDIVQGSFIDSYQNLSHKSVMGYKWVTERCRNAEYVIKTDDDIVINMFPVLQNHIQMLSINKYHVHCLQFHYAPIVRNKGDKFYVEPSQFNGEKFYPPYCNGQYVMILNDIVPYLYESASQTPLFWIDDVFLYGIVMNNIPALKYKEIQPEEYETFSNSKLEHFWKRKKQTWRYIYYVTQNVVQMIDLWSVIFKHYM